MKIRALGLFMGAAGSALLASTATAAPFVFPNATDVNIKLRDAGQLYTVEVDGDDTIVTPSPRADAFALYDSEPGPGFQPAEILALKGAIEGNRDYTAFRLTTYSLNGDANDTTFAPRTLTGVVTFLKVGTLDATPGTLLGGIVSLDLVDDSSATRGNSGAAAGQVGRFFLFDNTDNPNAGSFNTAGGLPGDVQWFDTTGAGATVSSNGVDFFDIDLLDNFTIGTAGNATTTTNLLLTGNIQQDVNGQFLDILTNSGLTGVSFSGLIQDTVLEVDGGYWFDIGSVTNPASFKINQTGYTEAWNGQSGDDSNFPGFGDENVFEGGWQISSEDPIQFTTNAGGEVPEPATAGLSILGLGALAGFVTRRRAR